jgi:hypothetical protein
MGFGASPIAVPASWPDLLAGSVPGARVPRVGHGAWWPEEAPEAHLAQLLALARSELGPRFWGSTTAAVAPYAEPVDDLNQSAEIARDLYGSQLRAMARVDEQEQD